LSNCEDCQVYCRGQINCSCNPKPHPLCPGQGINCCCASWTTPSPSSSPSASPSISCCGVRNCCKDYNVLNNAVNFNNTKSGGCAGCSMGTGTDVPDDCNPAKCPKTKCYTARCTSQGSHRATIGQIVKIGGGTKCSVSYNACTAATSPTVGGVCDGTYPLVPGADVPLSC
jgi:hypothetical protein